MTVVAFSCVQSRMSGVTSTEQISIVEKSTFKTPLPLGLFLYNQPDPIRFTLEELLCQDKVSESEPTIYPAWKLCGSLESGDGAGLTCAPGLGPPACKCHVRA